MAKTKAENIVSVKAREILNARGFPTLEASVTLSSGLSSKAEVPIGIYSSKFSAQDLYDGDHRRFQGKGMLLAANHINELIAPRLIGLAATAQREIDLLLIELDASPDRRQLGANTMMAVSLAVARAGAMSENKELFQYLSDYYQLNEISGIPTPLFNMFSGGHHADTNLDFKEFLLIPQPESDTFTSTSSEAQAVRMIRAGAEVYHALGKILRENSYDSDIGLEGGYAPNMDSSLKALDLMLAAVVSAGYEVKKDFVLGLDIGSSQLYDLNSKQYIFPLDNSYFSSQNLVALYTEWLQKYPIVYLEDGLASDDWSAWREATVSLGGKLVLAGDELFASSLERLRRGIAEQAANAFVLKPNQIGTLTETIECAKLAKRQHYQIIVSHRGGETNDDFIVDLAFALGAQYLKAGSLSRGERVSKYNRLMAIAAIMTENSNTQK
ncbi:phosphopyruvate hydratase [Patescibacteria group bacterium]|nr:phosphopyruvate hydratase [Patescibacteria group bacterium]